MRKIHGKYFFCSCRAVARAVRTALPLILIVPSFVSCGGEQNGGAAASGRKLLGANETVVSGTEELKIAIHYVSFKDSSGRPLIDESTVRKVVADMSSDWRQCGISYGLEKYEAIDAVSASANQNPANYSDLDSMREKLQNGASFLVIATGSWNRSGDLGNSGSNCFSSFPGDQADGTVCEAAVLGNSRLLAHEVGHWLNLYHTDNPDTDFVDDTASSNVATNLMNHFVAQENRDLTRGQCDRARASIAQSRRNAVLQ